MTRQLRELERIDARALAALRFVDAGTGADVETAPMLLALEGRARFVKNHRGLHVVASWSKLAAHDASFFAPPAEPEVGSVTLPIAVADPSEPSGVSERLRLTGMNCM